MDVKPEFLEGELGRGVEGVFELREEGLIVLVKLISARTREHK